MNKILTPFLALCAALAAHTAQAYTTPKLPAIPAGSFNIVKYGAVGDGVATNTAAIQAALDAASAAGGGTVELPSGIYLSGPLHLASGINFHLDAGAILEMLPLDKYPGGTGDPENFITGSGLHDISITGSGMINGQGIPWWPYAKTFGARRPIMIRLTSCTRLLIENVTLTNSPMFHIAISGGSSDVTVRGVTIRANPSSDPVNPGHNTDACDVGGHNILVENCDISVGDDDFTCSGHTSDVLITNNTYGFGHGVSIGSFTAGGVSNITVINCTFNGTEQGIRIKSDRGRGGYVHNLKYLNLSMTNVIFPILIYGTYTATNHEYRDLARLTPDTAVTFPRRTVINSTPIYSDFLFSNITATVQPEGRAGLIWGLPEMNVSNVVMQQVNITADKPFGIYDAQNISLIDSKIATPDGINKLSVTNAQINIVPE
ncbi:MAG TPA: glycosyl hydrolase family 28 protein [Verrucomicrobiae bacterium]|jgi:polygalacturonase